MFLQILAFFFLINQLKVNDHFFIILFNFKDLKFQVKD